MNLSINQIEEIASESKYLRGEFRDKLYGDQDGYVAFEPMMEFLLDNENRQTIKMMVNLAKKLSKS